MSSRLAAASVLQGAEGAMIQWALRMAVVATVAGLLMATGLSRRDDAVTLAQWAFNADPVPQPPVAETAAGGWNEVVIEADRGGHFLMEMAVNGAPVLFLVDTGASAVVLSSDDARRVGLDPRRLTYSQRFQTANGVVRAAPVTLREVRVGQFSVYDLPASVNEAPLAVSLLGMSFLSRLAGYEVRGDRLVLRW
jgi:aspartyl protease family protein